MLSKKDKAWLEKTIENKVRECLTIRIKMETKRDMKTGQPLATPEIEIKDVYMPSFLVEYIPYIEGSVRGVQEQICLEDGSRMKQIAAIGNILLQFENSLKLVSHFSDNIKQLQNNDDIQTIEYKEEKD